MAEIIKMNLAENKIRYNDQTEVTYSQFYDELVKYWDQRIAGETVSPFYIERFMKRSSSKNLKQLIDGKKAEGILEATLGKKMDPGVVRFILIMIVVLAVVGIAFFIMQQLGLF